MKDNWRWCTLGEIAQIVGGSTPSTADPTNFDGDIPWLTPKDLSEQHDRYVSRGNRNLSKKGLNNCSAQILPPGTILLTSRAPIGYIAIAKNYIATNQGFRNLILKPGFNPEFIYYWLKAHVEELKRHASGSTFQELSGSALAQIPILAPSLNEQYAIAHILGTLDDKIELLRRMNETLETMARAIFKSWFVDFDPVVVNALKAGNPIPEKFAKRAAHYHANPNALGLPDHILCLFPSRFTDSDLGPIPEGWEVKKLFDICSTQYGYTTNAVGKPIGPKFLRVTDINKQNWIEWNEVPYCMIPSDAKQAYALKPGDLVVARMADPGKSAIIEEEIDAVFASYLVRLRTKTLALSYYIYGFLKSNLFSRYVERAKSGSVQANMNAKVIVGANLIIPPDKVMNQFLRAVLPLRQRLVYSVRESDDLEALRDTLLPKLISGKIRIKS